jgi:2-succinyl-5-enolpyruvyl-6-hydroxy-3-cyclohexene-1-carboxylate synthase
MSYSLFQKIPSLLLQHGVKQVVLSPGSRCAPLTIPIVRHGGLHTISVVDERSAAYVALGISVQSRSPVAMVCTSGTAALNYAPAIAEAFYLGVPLIAITADRPEEWINQNDGQSIQQRDLYGKHVKASFQLPADLTHPDAQWSFLHKMQEAISLAQEAPKGPVHLNIPLREPLYTNAHLHFEELVPTWKHHPILPEKIDQFLAKELEQELKSVRSILWVHGQDSVGLKLKCASLIPVAGEVSSNLRGQTVTMLDGICSLSESALPSMPDLLITSGGNIASRNIRQFLRNGKPMFHWHLGTRNNIEDTFQHITRHIRYTPELLDDWLSRNLKKESPDDGYRAMWHEKSRHILECFYKKSNENFTEFEALETCLQFIPARSHLHLGNSMPIRYADYLGHCLKESQPIHCNRGTSGIDGVLSTAVGAALATTRQVWCLLGDVSFFYDQNALWNNQLPQHLRVVVLNNQGGGIFRMLNGSSEQAELEDWFETRHERSAESIAASYGLRYYQASTSDKLKKQLKEFVKEDGLPALLEIHTDAIQNTAHFKEFKQLIKSSL